MPVVTVEKIDAPIRVGASRKFCRDPAEEPKAAMIIRPIQAVRVRIWAARAIIESRMIDQVDEALTAAGQSTKAYPHSLGREGRV